MENQEETQVKETELFVIENDVPIPQECFTNKKHKYEILKDLEVKQSIVVPRTSENSIISVKQAISKFRKENNITDKIFICSEVTINTKGDKGIRIWRTT